MEFHQLIENNACLKQYFTEFPKKLKQLATEGKVIKFSDDGIEVDPEKLGDYLASKSSILPINTVLDFFETLQVLQFSKNCSTKNKISFLFVHPNFGKDIAIADDFYKQAIGVFKGTKRMRPMHHIDLLNRVIRMKNCNKIKLTKLEFARLKLQFTLQRKIDLIKYEEDVIDHNIEDPEYKKNSDIAGYYGDVQINILQTAFRNYFPIYQNNVVEPMQVYKPAEAVENQTEDHPMDNEMTNTEHPVEQINDQISQEIIVDEIIPPQISNMFEQKKFEETEDENKENQPPLKKRRKHTTRSGKITLKETNDALVNLQKEFGAMTSNI